MTDPKRAVLMLIAVTFVARLAFAWSVGLGVDEAYTVATARHFQLGQFDHPPGAWWLTWSIRSLSGSEHAVVLRLPFIALFALTTWLMFALTARLFGPSAGLWAATTLNFAPVIAWTSGTWIVPDGPLNAALLAGVLCASHALFGARSKASAWWLAAGACGGLALLSKFHGVFLFAGVALFLITSPAQRGWLLTPWPYAGTFVALSIFSPVILWNAGHGWASFLFQAGRALPREISLLGPFAALAGQALFLLPWLWAPLVACLGKTFVDGPADARRWLMACLAIGPIVMFTAVGLTVGRVLYHWAAPGYLMLFPVLGDAVARAIKMGHRAVKVWLAATAASLAILLLAVVTVAHLPWPALSLPGGRRLPYPLIEALDWRDLSHALEVRGLMDTTRLFIAATRWHEAGRIDYALRGRLPVLCLGRDPRGYGVLARPEEYIGKDGLIIGHNLPRSRVEAAYSRYFRSIENLPPVVLMRVGEPAIELSLYRGYDFRLPSDSHLPRR